MKSKQGSTVRKQILVPLFVLVGIQILLLSGIIMFGGVINKLDENAYDIFREKTINRKTYIQNDMVKRWSNVAFTYEEIVKSAENLKMQQGDGSFSTIESNEQLYVPFLEGAMKPLIDMMRTNRVTGAFIVINTSDLENDMQNKTYENKAGIYLRDSDPDANPSMDNADILVDRMPTKLTKNSEMSLNTSWRPTFEFQTEGFPYYDFLYEPYQAAMKNPEIGYADLGYWSEPYELEKANMKAISYSVPLILEDGTVFGVLGVELSISYLKKQLPYSELMENSEGAYVLAIDNTGNSEFQNIMVSGPVFEQNTEGEKTIVLRESNAKNHEYEVVFDKKRATKEWNSSVQYLELYNSNTPFENQQWALISVISKEHLNQFSNSIGQALVIAIGIALGIGLFGVIIISIRISNPIMLVAARVRTSNPTKQVVLEKTGIRELDELAGAIEEMSLDLFETSNKFYNILKMASIKMGAYEISFDTNNLYITKDFFRIFGKHNIDYENMTVGYFRDVIKSMDDYIVKEEIGKEAIYKIVNQKNIIYVRLQNVLNGTKSVGLAEDITKDILALEKIEYERDYDVLTNLLNRRAFQRIIEDIFIKGKEYIKKGALVMIDLDNLKFINDTYGHDFGDAYIREAATYLKESIDPNAIIGRISGDEFLIFVYGYETQEIVEEEIKRIVCKIKSAQIILPDTKVFRIKMSGGVAWYETNAMEYDVLKRYADFAMYKVKNSVRDDFAYFDKDSYQDEAYLLQCKEDLYRLIEHQLVEYYFQPIIQVETASVFAYEALMRSNVNSIPTVFEILSLARQEFKLGHIERLTWFKAMEAFVGHIENGSIHQECKIFINSLPSQDLTEIDVVTFENIYEKYLHLIVQEITEEEKINEYVQEEKTKRIQKWKGELAVDDYGSGYNGEGALLNITAKYIKVDLNIIRDIDKNKNKQKIVQNLISYTHERDIEIIAEGIETYEEMETVVLMGVDYLQGYYFAKPAFEIPHISEKKLIELKKVTERMNS